MASDVLPDPDTPTTATVRHNGTSTSISRRLLCRAPCTPMTAGRVPGTEISPAVIPGTLRPTVSGHPGGTPRLRDQARTGAGVCQPRRAVVRGGPDRTGPCPGAATA